MPSRSRRASLLLYATAGSTAWPSIVPRGSVDQERDALHGPTLHPSERPTIPEVLAQAGKSLEGFATIPSGPPPIMAFVLKDTDTVVTGRIGAARSYLSADQRDVYTDCIIDYAKIMNASSAISSSRPGVVPSGGSLRVTVRGGSVRINGLTYTFIDKALPSLPRGSECLLLLKRMNDHYRLAGRYLGAFRIADNKLEPITRVDHFASEYRSLSAMKAIDEITAHVRALTERC